MWIAGPAGPGAMIAAGVLAGCSRGPDSDGAVIRTDSAGGEFVETPTALWSEGVWPFIG